MGSGKTIPSSLCLGRNPFRCRPSRRIVLRFRPDEVNRLASNAAKQEDVSIDLVRAVMRQESGFRPCAVSTSGAQGLMQLMPATAADLQVSDPFDPKQNVTAGARYLKQLLQKYGGDLQRTLGAYNAGPARVDTAGGVPAIPETQNYVSDILSRISVN